MNFFTLYSFILVCVYCSDNNDVDLWNQTYHADIQQLEALLPFFNNSKAQHANSFYGYWLSDKNWTPFSMNTGKASLYFSSQSYEVYRKNSLKATGWEPESGQSLVKNLNSTTDSTLLTAFSFEINLLEDKYMDNSVQIRFQFQLSGWNSNQKMFSDDNTLFLSPTFSASQVQVYKIYEPQNQASACNLNASLQIVNLVNNTKLVGNLNQQEQHDLEFINDQKEFQIIINVDANEKCQLPFPIELKFRNEPAPDIDIALFRLAMTLVILSLCSLSEIGDQLNMIHNTNPIPDQVSVFPLIQLDAWNFAMLSITMIICVSLPRGKGMIMYIPFLFMLINAWIMHRYVTLVIRKAIMTRRARRSANLIIVCLVLSYLIIVPTLLSSDYMTLAFLSFLWVPQIIQNCKHRRENRRHKYRGKFLFVQTALWVVLVFETRSGGFLFQSDSDFGVLYLKPHPTTILQLFCVLGLQIFILLLQQSELMTLRTLARFCRRMPTWLPGRTFSLQQIRRYRERRQGNNYIYFRKFEEFCPNYDQVPQTEQSQKQRQIEKDDDCVICLCSLRYSPDVLQNQQQAPEEVPDIEAQTKVECLGYFFTPCNHPFHAVCLRRWTLSKLECPTCRHELQPIGIYDGLNEDQVLEIDN